MLLGTALCLLEGYLLGSISFSIIVSRVFKGEDIRNFGSKNAGMTNILRTYGKKYALMCGAGDFCSCKTAPRSWTGFLPPSAGRLSSTCTGRTSGGC